MRRAVLKVALLVAVLSGIAVILFFTVRQKYVSDLTMANVEALASGEFGEVRRGQELIYSVSTEIVYDYPCDDCSDSQHFCSCNENYMVQVREWYCREVNDSDAVCNTEDEEILREILTPCTCFKSGDL